MSFNFSDEKLILRSLDLDLFAVAAIADWADLRDNHLTERFGSVIKDDGDTLWIRLESVDINDLNTADCIS